MVRTKTVGGVGWVLNGAGSTAALVWREWLAHQCHDIAMCGAGFVSSLALLSVIVPAAQQGQQLQQQLSNPLLFEHSWSGANIACMQTVPAIRGLPQ